MDLASLAPTIFGQGSGTSSATPYSFDTSQLQAFIGTTAGQQYAGLYNPSSSYYQVGDSIQASSSANETGAKTAGTDVTAMVQAYQNWVGSNNQTKTNWQAYADAVNANGGGEGDNTITQGAAVSQRNQLLGALANVGQPTAPTPGLGSMGNIK